MLIALTQELNQRRPHLNRFRRYFLGKQKVTFMGAELQHDFGKQLSSLSCNRCSTVIDAVLDRLDITGFEDKDDTSDHEDKVKAYWDSHNMESVARQVHQEALVHGDGYLLVWPGDDIEVYSQHSDQFAVIYDDEYPDKIVVAAKSWKLRDGRWRMNLYYEDRLEKYKTRKPEADLPEQMVNWEEHQDDADSTWPVQYTFGRVPVFHFSVNARAGEYGRSDLEAIIPLQDSLNRTLANQAVAEEFQSYKQRWATGIQPIEVELEDGTTEYVSPFEEGGADRLWTSTNENTKFGEFDSADLRMFIEEVEAYERLIARTARIPLHYIVQSGTPPSGESLKTAEAPFVAKVKDRQRSFGGTWNQLINFLLFLDSGVQSRVEVVWASPEARMESQALEHAVLKQSLGVSKAQILRELNYSDAQILEFAEENDTDLDALTRAFNEA